MSAAPVTVPTVDTKTFPKSARLLKSREFSLQACERFQTEHFRFFYTKKGQGRLGVSLSKKVMKQAVARNRVKRLLREVFRASRGHLGAIDVHIIGREALRADWDTLARTQVEKEFQKWESNTRRS